MHINNILGLSAVNKKTEDISNSAIIKTRNHCEDTGEIHTGEMPKPLKAVLDREKSKSVKNNKINKKSKLQNHWQIHWPKGLDLLSMLCPTHSPPNH